MEEPMMTSRAEEHQLGPARTGTVKVPGATLFYKVSGSGPYLMMLCGGAGDADGFGSIAPYLTALYTVVTYDRRGLSRSPLDEQGNPAINIPTRSEDVHRVLNSLHAAPALVFGSSIGALIGLDLLIRHPGGRARSRGARAADRTRQGRRTGRQLREKSTRRPATLRR
jgi:pimeloyl-ACP methyl ester carboxylesterase